MHCSAISTKQERELVLSVRPARRMILHRPQTEAHNIIASANHPNKNTVFLIIIIRIGSYLCNPDGFSAYSGRFPPNRPKWVHFCRSLPHSAKKSPFPGIKKAGQGRTPSGQMTQFLHFIPSEGALSSIWPHILTLHLSKHAKATQASHQNLGGYMCPNRYDDTGCDHQLDQIRLSFLHAETA